MKNKSKFTQKTRTRLFTKMADCLVGHVVAMWPPCFSKRPTNPRHSIEIVSIVLVDYYSAHSKLFQ